MKYKKFLGMYLFYIFWMMIKSWGKEVTIHQNDSNFSNLAEIITTLQNILPDGEPLILNFTDLHYAMTELPYNVDITLNRNITFRGNTQGTVFDYEYERKGILSIHYTGKENTMTFQNIQFENFQLTNGIRINYLYAIVLQFKGGFALFLNCTFQNNKQDLIGVSFANKQNPTQFIQNLQFDHCHFYNNTEKLLGVNRGDPRYIESKINLLNIQYVNTQFLNNRSLFRIHYNSLLLKNCYISGLEKDSDEETKGLFIQSTGGRDTITIENTVVENIHIGKTYTLLNESNAIKFQINNSTFRNCKTNQGYLFRTKNSSSDEAFVEIKNSTFENTSTLFYGDYNKYVITDSVFQDTQLKNSIPAIIDSKYSEFIITNSEFRRLSLVNSLFNDESIYFFRNITLYKITTNSNYLFYFSYHNISIDGMRVEEVKCIGDGGDSSFILFDSGENHYTLTIKSLTLTNSVSNGPFIKALGYSSAIYLHHLDIKEITVYGPILEIESENSIIDLSESNFLRNSNTNKNNCGGSIHGQNNLNVTMTNTIFEDNSTKSNGGAICFDNISSMELRFVSNTFIKNKALNGGAIYFSESENFPLIKKNNTTTIIFKNNYFRENMAEYFGGALYSNCRQLYQAQLYNNTIVYNRANVMGGGLYSPKFAKEKLFSLENMAVHDNTINNFMLNDYATLPSYVSLNTTLKSNPFTLTTGDLLPLTFILYDEFDHIFMDPTKYYASLTLKLFLEEIKVDEGNEEKEDNKSQGNVGMGKGQELSESSLDLPKEQGDKKLEYNQDELEDHSTNTNIYLLGNVGYFINGKCELNNFKIYANPGKYYLTLKFDDTQSRISIHSDKIELDIRGCSDHQIQMKSKYGIPYCENPICPQTCPVGLSAVCISPYKESINLESLNTCQCLSGYEGENCSQKVFVDFSLIHNFLIWEVIIVFTLFTISILFIMDYRKRMILDDIGWFKITLVLVGLMIYYLSHLFITYTSYVGCSIHFFFKHSGLGLFFFILFLFVNLNYKLGIRPTIKNNISIKLLNKLGEDTDPGDQGISESFHPNENHRLPNIKTTLMKAKTNSMNFENMELNESVLKIINNISSLHLHLFLGYIFFIFMILFIVLFQKNKSTENNGFSIIQNDNGKWIYQCSLEKSDLFLDILELFMIVIILVESNQLFHYNNIFRYTKYIAYVSRICIILGPLLNIISYIILNNQRLAKILFDTILNSISYLMAIFLLGFKTVMGVVETSDNNDLLAKKYFIYKRHDKCNIHHCTTCECLMNMGEGEFKANIRRSIDFYKVCSTFIEIDHGKFTLLNGKNKLQFLDYRSNSSLQLL